MEHLSDSLCNLQLSSDMTNDEKYNSIIRSSLNNKSISLLPGVDDYVLNKFYRAGYNKIEHMLGHYLLFDKDVDTMNGWLEAEICISDYSIRNLISGCLHDWCDMNL